MQIYFLFPIFIQNYYAHTQDYHLMYEPLYPSGSNRMAISSKPDTKSLLDSEISSLGSSILSSLQPNVETKVSEGNSKQESSSSEPELSGLNGTPCRDLYTECPEYKEHNYCTNYRKQMMFQCRKSCGFCDINPYEYDENEDEDEDEHSGKGDENSGSETEESTEETDDEENSGETKRSIIPETDQLDSQNIDQVLYEDEKHFNSLKSRFKMPGLVPSLEDLYAEIGTLHPSIDQKKKNVKFEEIKKRSKIAKKEDPFKYLKDTSGGASIDPIVDTSSLSSTRVQRSNPVYVMKSPKSYIGTIRSKRSIDERKRKHDILKPTVISL